MLKKVIFVLVLFTSGFSFAGDSSMYDQPIKIGPYLKSPVAAILKGMNDHDWVVRSESPGKIVALLDYRMREIVLEIDYNKSEISFKPISDKKIGCKGTEQECRVEEAYYKSWRNNLRASIKDAADDMTQKAMKSAIGDN